ncbi:MAG TPA: hypothetical protein VIV55_09915 [Flavobacterium sp.]
MSKFKLTLKKLESLEVGEKFIRKDFITELWGEYNYFINTSFSQMFYRAKHKINDENENKKYFRSIKNEIIRIF